MVESDFMNAYDKKYIFRLAVITDVPDIMKYIDQEWKNGHILACNKEFFLWQYGNIEYEDYENINVVLMCEKETQRIVGINCYIKYSNMPDKMFVSSAITKISPDVNIPMAGVELIRRFHSLVPANAYFSYGTNPKTMLPIGEKIFGYHTGIMQQYYMLNMEIEDFCIAKIDHPVTIPYASGNCSLIEIHNLAQIDGMFDFERCYKKLPYKSKKFIQKRYFDHPIYQYKKWKIENMNGLTEGILFGREIIHENAKVLRLVDFRGNIDSISEIGAALHTILTQGHYEYIDLMVSELPKGIAERSGFVLLDVDGNNIIPNYFEPYVKENIKTYFQESEDIIIFKADGDQDRPNTI